LCTPFDHWTPYLKRYHPHPSDELQRLFQQKPYQGADPQDAAILFVGLDANFAADVASTEFFPRIVEYLTDGVKVWEDYGVHHPFLLPGYRGDGRFYHRSFARLGLSSALASHISFVELIGQPTVGTSRLSPEDLNPQHLSRLARWIEGDSTRLVFVPSSVGALMFASGAFTWMKRKRPQSDAALNHLKVWGVTGNTRILWHYHFSVYGKFEAEKAKQLSEMSALVIRETSER